MVSFRGANGLHPTSQLGEDFEDGAITALGGAMGRPSATSSSLFARSPSESCPPLPFFGWEGSPTKVDYRKVGTLILSSLLEDLVWSHLCPFSLWR